VGIFDGVHLPKRGTEVLIIIRLRYLCKITSAFESCDHDTEENLTL
jgi:hypothetical protein